MQFGNLALEWSRERRDHRSLTSLDDAVRAAKRLRTTRTAAWRGRHSDIALRNQSRLGS